MEKWNRDKLVKVAYITLAIAILSIFTTIIGYTNGSGEHKSFSLLDFFVNGSVFNSFVLWDYTGTVVWDIGINTVRFFVVLGVVAVICAVAGVSMVSKQKENKWSFRLALIGLVGTMAPSLLILVSVVLLRGNFSGKISCGIYPIVTPIAMIVCILATTQMHRRNLEYERKLKEAEGLIFRGEDL